MQCRRNLDTRVGGYKFRDSARLRAEAALFVKHAVLFASVREALVILYVTPCLS